MRTRSALRWLAAALVYAVGLLAWPPHAPRLHSQGSLTIGGFLKVGERRITRDITEFDYRATLSNSGAGLAGATASATSHVPETVLVDGEVTFGAVGPGGSVVSTDTFTFRHDRRVAFAWSNLQWTVNGSPANLPPTAEAGPAQSAPVGQVVTLDGSASTDPEGQALTYEWTVTSRPAASAAVPLPAGAVMPTVTLDQPGTYQFRLVVNDGVQSSAPDTVVISTVNSVPVASAGPDRSALVNVPVTLDGSGSFDVDGQPLTYAWSQVSGPAPVAPAPLTAVLPTVTLPAAGTYVFALVVHDGAVSSAPDTVVVSTTNTPPVANAGPDQLTAPVAHIVTLDGSGSADADGDPLAYAWAVTAQPLGGTAILTGAATPAPTFVPNVAGDYVAQLQVHDGFVASVIDTVVIRVVAADLPVLTVVSTDPTAGESGSEPGVFTVSRTGPTMAPLVVSFTLSGTATPGDYTVSVASPLTIPAGQASAEIVVTPIDDGLVEGDETSVLTLLDTADYDVAAPNAATIVIASDDSATPLVSVTAIDATATENPVTTAAFRFSRTGSVSQPLTVPFFRVGTAVLGSDYSLSPNLVSPVTFPIGVASIDVTLTPFDDGLVEPDETAGFILLDGSDYDLGASNQAMVVIQSDEALPTVTVTAPVTSVNEPLSQTAVFEFRRTGNLSQPLVVSYALGGPATVGVDYTLSPNNQTAVTFAAGSNVSTLLLTAIGDAEFELSETVTATLVDAAAYDLGSPAAAAITILSDDMLPVVSLSVFGSSGGLVQEFGGAESFVLSRVGPLAQPLVVTVALSGTATRDADYTLSPAITTNVTFPAGASEVPVNLSPVDDTLVEPDETVTLTLLDGAAYDLAANPSRTMTILSDDVTPVVTVEFASLVSTLIEGSVSNFVEFRFQRTGSTTQPLTVSVSRAGSATADADYILFPVVAGSVTFPAGSAFAIVTLQVVDDLLVEPDETFSITLLDGPSYDVGGPPTRTVTIRSDDVTPVVTVALDSVDPIVQEDSEGSTRFRFERTGPAAQPLVVSVVRGGSATVGADFGLIPQVSGSVTFPVGFNLVYVDLFAIDDSLVEPDETVTFTVVEGQAYDVGSPSTATAIIRSEDVSPF